MTHNDRLSAAIERNYNEVTMSILQRKAIHGIEVSDNLYLGWDFFHFAYIALFNDMIARAIRVLDFNKDSATFWYIYKQYEKDIDLYLSSLGITIQPISTMANSLKDLRDTVIFHIDKKGVLDPEAMWNNANIKGDEFANIIDILGKVLTYIYNLHFGKETLLPEYTGEDVTRIIKHSQEAGIIF